MSPKTAVGVTLDTTIDGPVESDTPPVTANVVLSDELLPALSVAVIETVYVPEGMPDDGKVH